MSIPNSIPTLLDPSNVALTDPDMLSDSDILSDVDYLSDSESDSDAETVLPPPPSPSPPLSQFVPSSPSPPRPPYESNQDVPTEECLICKEEAPITEYTTLPCRFGHRYMSSCILQWAKIQGSLSSCPMCRESLAYKKCCHNIEPARLEGGDCKISRHELQARRCWLCRDLRRHERICRFYRSLLQDNADWNALRPGDVRTLEQMVGRDYKEKLQETQQKHAKLVETWRRDLRRHRDLELDGSDEEDAASAVSGMIFRLEYKLGELARVEEHCDKPASERVRDRTKLMDHRSRLDEERYQRMRRLRGPRNTPRDSPSAQSTTRVIPTVNWAHVVAGLAETDQESVS
jgi:hypothetical protein